MFRTLIASLTRKPARIIAPAAAPAFILVPLSRETVRGYDYGRSELRRKAIAARQLDRRASF